MDINALQRITNENIKKNVLEGKFQSKANVTRKRSREVLADVTSDQNISQIRTGLKNIIKNEEKKEAPLVKRIRLSNKFDDIIHIENTNTSLVTKRNKSRLHRINNNIRDIAKTVNPVKTIISTITSNKSDSNDTKNDSLIEVTDKIDETVIKSNQETIENKENINDNSKSNKDEVEKIIDLIERRKSIIEEEKISIKEEAEKIENKSEDKELEIINAKEEAEKSEDKSEEKELEIINGKEEDEKSEDKSEDKELEIINGKEESEKSEDKSEEKELEIISAKEEAEKCEDKSEDKELEIISAKEEAEKSEDKSEEKELEKVNTKEEVENKIDNKEKEKESINNKEEAEENDGYETEKAEEQDWDDLDAEDEFDPIMVSEYVEDIFEYLREKELTTRPDPEYINNRNPELSWKMRDSLVDWLIQLHFAFKFTPETLYLTMNIVDRFLSVREIPNDTLPLVGLASLFIAAKYEEIIVPPIDQFLKTANHCNTQEEVFEAERVILKELNFDLNYPNPLSFLRRVSKADEYETYARTMSKFFMELSLTSHEFLYFLPSQITAASMYLSRIMLNRPEWTPNLRHYSGYSEEELRDCVSLLVTTLASPPKKWCKCVLDKYALRKFLKVSLYARQWLRQNVDKAEELIYV